MTSDSAIFMTSDYAADYYYNLAQVFYQFTLNLTEKQIYCTQTA